MVTGHLRLEDVGVTAHATSGVDRAHAELLADALDRRPPGEDLPPLWHWAFFPPRVLTADLGPDGHPARPDEGPLRGLPRRMWIGGRISWHGSLAIAQTAERRSTIEAVERKAGRQGEFALVTVRHEIHQGGQLVVEEEQDLAFRAASVAPPDDAPPAELAVADGEALRPVGAALLFRYSALTFNTHRIHYDPAYGREVEGYPALVVQGPLLATLLADRCADVELSTFTYRSSAPAFGPGMLALGRRDEAGRCVLWARRDDGTEVMQATATRPAGSGP